jgi:hypothetical protein
MKSSRARDQFDTWSRRWKDERKHNNPAEIIKLWRDPLPRGWARENWRGKVGYRKQSDHRGEQVTENKLFASHHKQFQLLWSDSQREHDVSVQAIYHNMPLANQRSGQVIADAFGILRVGEKARPLFIEVKQTADNPWFALVENLQQIRLARACADQIRTFTVSRSKLSVEPGVWGLILAPNSFYKKHSISLERCRSLLGELKRRTTARVAFGSSDSLVGGKISIVADNWFSRC